MRRTLSDALASRIPTSLNLISTDTRVIQYVNSATERLLNRGHWWGTCPRYSVSVTNQLFSLPPQFATMEKIAVSHYPVMLRNSWYEFADHGIGSVDDPTASTPNTLCARQALFRGNFPTSQDIVSGNKIRVQCDVVDDVAVNVLVLGYDSSGNWLRTKVAGVWQDGETIAASQSPGTISSTTWGRITDVQKPVSKGQFWITQIDGVTNPIIANYQYWETNPSYTRYLLPTIANTATQIDLIGKLSFRPVTNSTDYLLIGNLEAIRLEAVAIKLEEEHMISEATALTQRAIVLLCEELEHYKGAGEMPSIQVIGANMDGCAVEQLL
jgi:hypothetical protein